MPFYNLLPIVDLAKSTDVSFIRIGTPPHVDVPLLIILAVLNPLDIGSILDSRTLVPDARRLWLFVELLSVELLFWLDTFFFLIFNRLL